MIKFYILLFIVSLLCVPFFSPASLKIDHFFDSILSSILACDCMHDAKLLQSCQTLCNPMDCSLSGSSVHGIFQVRILEWVAMPSSRGTS